MSRFSSGTCFAFIALLFHSDYVSAVWNSAEPAIQTSFVLQPAVGAGFVAAPGFSVQTSPFVTYPRALVPLEPPFVVSPAIVAAQELPLFAAPATLAAQEIPLSVTQFENSVLKQISAATLLQRIFALSNPSEDSDAHFSVVQNILQQAGVQNTYDSARKSSQTFGNSYTTLNVHQRTLAVARTIGKYLFQSGVLNQQNALDLATRFVNELFSRISENGIASDTSYLKILGDGFLNFVRPFGIFGPDTAKNAVDLYDQELLAIVGVPPPL